MSANRTVHVLVGITSALLASLAHGQASQQEYLKASNTGVSDRLGSAVGVSGDTVVVGAPWERGSSTGVNGVDDNAALYAGAAYVYDRDGVTWAPPVYLKASNTDAWDFFGTSVAVSGDTVVVGAPFEDGSAGGVDGTDDDNLENAGAVYVFVRVGTDWEQQAYLKAAFPDANDQFGNAVAISGDSIVVGALQEDGASVGVNGNEQDNAANWAGAAYVFAREGTVWAQEAYLKPSDTGASFNFGIGVAVSGDTVVVGARGAGATDSDGDSVDAAGAAYVFTRTGTSWSQQAKLTATVPGSDGFGAVVALSGETVAIGAPLEDSIATGVGGNPNNNQAYNSGAAYAFERTGTTWSQTAYLKASNTGEEDFFGRALAVQGDAIVVGAHSEDGSATGIDGPDGNDGATNSGALYVFVRSASGWKPASYVKASNAAPSDGFGEAVAASGFTVIAGAPNEDGSATGVGGDGLDDGVTSSGAAYVFLVAPAVRYCTASPNSTGFAADIYASGSPSVAVNDLVLRADRVPNEPGVFFYGPGAQSVPFGNGTLCVAGTIGRLDVVLGAGNVMTHALDVTAPPNPPTQITAGSTWNFQAWFRDPAAGGAFFDLSDAISLSFTP